MWLLELKQRHHPRAQASKRGGVDTTQLAMKTPLIFNESWAAEDTLQVIRATFEHSAFKDLKDGGATGATHQGILRVARVCSSTQGWPQSGECCGQKAAQLYVEEAGTRSQEDEGQGTVRWKVRG